MKENSVHKNLESAGSHFKCGYVALIGAPNVGKSTLMNNLLQIKLSIVTPKPQTTRHRVLGILNEDVYQIIFLDTPGLLKPQYKLQEIMVKTVHDAIDDADVIVYMVESKTDPTAADKSIFTELNDSKKAVVLVINKIDLINKDHLLPLIDSYNSQYAPREIIPISALHIDGLDILKQAIVSYLPIHPPLYPSDMLTEQPERFFVAEIIREKVFQNYGEEIPYSTTVMIEDFKERSSGKDYIQAVIYVERMSQKGILIGKKGSALKKVGQSARREIEEFLKRPVYLELHVRVKEKWRSKDAMLKELGYR